MCLGLASIDSSQQCKLQLTGCHTYTPTYVWSSNTCYWYLVGQKKQWSSNRITYRTAGNFCGRTFYKLVRKKKDLFREHFHQCHQKTPMFPNFVEKTSVHNHKSSKVVKVSPLKVSHYTVSMNDIFVQLCGKGIDNYNRRQHGPVWGHILIGADTVDASFLGERQRDAFSRSSNSGLCEKGVATNQPCNANVLMEKLCHPHLW